MIDASRFTEPPIPSVAALEEVLSEPSEALVEDMRALEGDILLLGVSGKMGPTLARLAKRAFQAAGRRSRVIGAARFREAGSREALESLGVETLSCDLLNEDELERLPDAPNVVFMAGRKFGSRGSEWLTWAVNTWLPGLVARRFSRSRIVALSTGNVYPLTPVAGGGACEGHPTGPIGEYAQSCLGRERIIEHFSVANGTPALFFRLNYAIDLRYGILLDVAQKVHAEREIDLTMGHVNVIWQGDANERVLRSFQHCSVPPRRLNVTGPEVVPIRWLAERFAGLMGRRPRLSGTEASTALLSNAQESMRLFGYPRVPLDRMIQWVAAWVLTSGSTLDKPTHFEEREGNF